MAHTTRATQNRSKPKIYSCIRSKAGQSVHDGNLFAKFLQTLMHVLNSMRDCSY